MVDIRSKDWIDLRIEEMECKATNMRDISTKDPVDMLTDYEQDNAYSHFSDRFGRNLRRAMLKDAHKITLEVIDC